MNNDKDLTIDLSNEQEKSFGAKKIELASDENIKLTFYKDIEGQIKYTESGENVLVTVYGTKNVAAWQKVVTFTSSEAVSEGPNKGKYWQSIMVYDWDEEQNDWSWTPNEEKSKRNLYVRTKGKGEVTTYQSLDANGNVLSTQSDEPSAPQGGASVDTKTVLGTVTYTNGKNAADTTVTLESKIYTDENKVSLLTEHYSPAYNSKKKKYTGSWLNENVDSTSVNETFALSTGDDKIVFKDKFGKDTVNLVKGATLTADFEVGEEANLDFICSQSGNNAVVTAVDVIPTDYDAKAVCTVSKKANSEGLYTVNIKWYNCNGTSYSTVSYESTVEYVSKADLSHRGLKAGKTSTIYAKTEYDEDVRHWTETTKVAPKLYDTFGTVTFKDYFKLAEDSVVFTSGEQEFSLKELLDDTVGFKGNSESKKAQKLTGTFLDEQFTGGYGNDTITTGVGTDFICFSGGKDTVTINGTGEKQIVMSGAQVTGTTTATFAKGVNLNETSLDINFDEDNTKFIKSGSDLIVTQTTEIEDGKFTTANVNVKNYFWALEHVVTFNYSTLTWLLADVENTAYLYQYGNAKKSNTMQDTKCHDYITGGNKADKIYIDSKGNDVIIGGAGNDIFYVGDNAQNTKTFKFTKGSGADTLTINSGSAEIVLDNDALYSNSGGEVSFEKTGSSLIMKTYYAPASKKTKAVTDTVNVTNYFGEIASPVKFAQSSSPENAVDLGEVLGNNYLTVNGVKSGKTMVYDGTDFKDSMTYTGSGKATMAGGGYDDSYTVKVTKTSDVVVTDTDGMNVLNLLNKASDIRIFFNADTDGNIVVNPENTGGIYEKTDFLWIYNKNAVNLKNIAGANTGKITVEHCFAGENPTGADHYSGVTTTDGDGYFNIAKYVKQIASEVATWFSAHTGYSDAMDVFDPSRQNGADKASLLAVYNQAYNPNFQMPQH